MRHFSFSLRQVLLLLTFPVLVQAQNVGIGTSTPNASAALDVQATDKGLLIPRLTQAQRLAIASPATGLLVYQTNGSQPGFWYTSGPPAAPGWTFFNPTADNLGNHTAQQNLNLQANALVGTGATIGAAVGVGVRADGGLNLGQNSTGNNVYLGYQAGQANTTGNSNLLLGYQAGRANTTGRYNLFLGYQSGYGNTTGTDNLFVGGNSGNSNTTGYSNLFSGSFSGFSTTTGSDNLFSGTFSGFSNSTGHDNLFVGSQSGYNNTTGNYNLFGGSSSGAGNTTGDYNVFSGYHSGLSNTTGHVNVFIGSISGLSNTTGYNNTFLGTTSGGNNTTGIANVFVGMATAGNNTTGSFNTALGYFAGPTNSALTNATALGYAAQVSQSNSLVLGGTGTEAVSVGIGTTGPLATLEVLRGTAPFGTAAFRGTTRISHFNYATAEDTYIRGGKATSNVLLNDNGGFVGIGTNAPSYLLDVAGNIRVNSTVYTSDARFKQHVRPLTGALAAVEALRSVRYDWNALGQQHGGLAGAEQVGLIAQEVEKIYPELVSTDKEGFKAVNYAQLTPVLIEALQELATRNAALETRAATDHVSLLSLQAQVARLVGEAVPARAEARK